MFLKLSIGLCFILMQMYKVYVFPSELTTHISLPVLFTVTCTGLVPKNATTSTMYVADIWRKNTTQKTTIEICYKSKNTDLELVCTLLLLINHKMF